MAKTNDIIVNGFPATDLYNNFDCAWKATGATNSGRGKVFEDFYMPYLNENGFTVRRLNHGTFRIETPYGSFDYLTRSEHATHIKSRESWYVPFKNILQFLSFVQYCPDLLT